MRQSRGFRPVLLLAIGLSIAPVSSHRVNLGARHLSCLRAHNVNDQPGASLSHGRNFGATSCTREGSKRHCSWSGLSCRGSVNPHVCRTRLVRNPGSVVRLLSVFKVKNRESMRLFATTKPTEKRSYQHKRNTSGCNSLTHGHIRSSAGSSPAGPTICPYMQLKRGPTTVGPRFRTPICARGLCAREYD